MRHLKAGRKLGRNAPHRLAMKRNMSCSLIVHERIITTVPKAKELRPFVERLITLAKRNSLHARRLILARLGGNKDVTIHVKKKDDEVINVVRKLFETLAPRYAERPGGYTRIIKRPQVRLGDAGATAFLELIPEGETKAAKAPAPAPAVKREDEAKD